MPLRRLQVDEPHFQEGHEHAGQSRIQDGASMPGAAAERQQDGRRRHDAGLGQLEGGRFGQHPPREASEDREQHESPAARSNGAMCRASPLLARRGAVGDEEIVDQQDRRQEGAGGQRIRRCGRSQEMKRAADRRRPSSGAAAAARPARAAARFRAAVAQSAMPAQGAKHAAGIKHQPADGAGDHSGRRACRSYRPPKRTGARRQDRCQRRQGPHAAAAYARAGQASSQARSGQPAAWTAEATRRRRRRRRKASRCCSASTSQNTPAQAYSGSRSNASLRASASPTDSKSIRSGKSQGPEEAPRRKTRTARPRLAAKATRSDNCSASPSASSPRATSASIPPTRAVPARDGFRCTIATPKASATKPAIRIIAVGRPRVWARRADSKAMIERQHDAAALEKARGPREASRRAGQERQHDQVARVNEAQHRAEPGPRICCWVRTRRMSAPRRTNESMATRVKTEAAVRSASIGNG